MSSSLKKPESLRSHRWYGPDDLRSFGHRSRTKQMGFLREEFVGKPVIGIINTWNEMNSCHTHFPERIKDVKRGFFQQEAPCRTTSDITWRTVNEAYRDDVPQFSGDGSGRTFAKLSN